MNVALRETAFLALLFLSIKLPAQIVSISPERPRVNDNVTIIFDASKGNRALMNYDGEVYAHTGVTIGTLENQRKWQYVQGEWGIHDPRTQMKYLGNQKYRLTFNIREFYQIPSSENFLQMAFVFRNLNGSKIGAMADGSDIYYPDLDHLEYGPLEQAYGKDGRNLGAMTSVSELEDGSLVIKDQTQTLLVRPYRNEVLNIRYYPKGEFSDSESPLVSRLKGNPEVSHRFIKTGDDYEISLKDSFSLRIFTNPIRLELYRDEILIMSEENGAYYDNKDPLVGDMVGFRMMIQPDEVLYETGYKGDPLNRRGKRYYNFPGMKDEFIVHRSEPVFPLLISSMGYGIFIENAKQGYLDLGKSEPGILEVGVRDSALSWFLFMGNRPQELIEPFFKMKGFSAKKTFADLNPTIIKHDNYYGNDSTDYASVLNAYARGFLSRGMGAKAFDYLQYPIDPNNEEYYLRKLQTSVFAPLMQIQEMDRLPESIRESAQKTILLRKKLLPYNYSLSWENHTKGTPLARPMYYYYPGNEDVQAIDDQYFWGQDLLVGVINQKAQTSKELYFPQGNWYDFFTSEMISEQGWHSVSVSPGHIPVYVKGGAILPLLPNPNKTFRGDSLEIHYYPDFEQNPSQTQIYLDDGISENAFEESNYLLIDMKGQVSKKGISLKLNTSGGGFPKMPINHYLDFHVNGIEEYPQKIFVNGKKVELVESEPELSLDNPAYALYLPGRKQLRIVWKWNQLPAEILIKGKFEKP